MKPTLPPLVLLALVVPGLVAGCGRRSAPAPGERLPVIPVRIVTVESTPGSAVEEVTGTVRAKLRAVIEAKIHGRIVRMHGTPGRQFAAGELLAELEAREIQARLEQAIAGRDQAERDTQRFRNLLAHQAVTAAEAEAVESRLRVTQAAVTEAETILGYARVTAPFDGVVTRKLADVGDLAAPGRALLELEDPRALRLEAGVPEALIGRVAPGARMTVRVPAIETELAATVSEIAPAADPDSRTFLVKLDLPPAPGLRAGQFGRVAVPVAAGAVLSVPAAAVVQRGQLEMVFVVADGRAQMRLVKTGKRVGDRIELLSGVGAGEQVVVEGAAGLTDGQRVEAR